VVVDRHAGALDPFVEEDVGKGPVVAVDVAVHGEANVEALLRPEAALRGEGLAEERQVGERRKVREHRRALHETLRLRSAKAPDIRSGGRAEGSLDLAGRLHRPPEGSVVGSAAVAVNETQGVVDEARLELPENGLIDGEADVGVRLVDDADCVELHCLLSLRLGASYAAIAAGPMVRRRRRRDRLR
jgi:hypothetical protein